jgi:hypothetical protein
VKERYSVEEQEERWARQPDLSDAAELVKLWIKPDRSERVYIYRRASGDYARSAEHFSYDPMEMAWIPHDRGMHIYGDVDIAERETLADYHWARDVEPRAF